jgi:hypothetical protein
VVAEDEIRQASKRSYGALNHVIGGDPQPMVEIWSHDSDVAIMHPLGGRRLGRE